MKVLLTGGIGSGKSTVASIFAEIGVPVIYVDLINKSLLSLPEVQKKYQKVFGQDCFDKKKLKKEHVKTFYENDDIRHKIQKSMTPLVLGVINEEYNRMVKKNPYVIIECAQADSKNYDKTIQVYANHKVRRERVVERDNKTYYDFHNIIGKQKTDYELFQTSDYTIINDEYYHGNSFECLRLQCEKIHDELIKKCKEKNIPDFPLNRIIKEGCVHFCDNCGSTMSKNGFLGLFGDRLCHNDKCPNSKPKK